MIIAELDPYADEFEFEDFTFDIDEHFSKHLEKQVYVEGKNLTWRNLTGTKTFTLNKTRQIWQELTPDNTDSLTSGSSPGWLKHSSIIPIFTPLIELSKPDK